VLYDIAINHDLYKEDSIYTFGEQLLSKLDFNFHKKIQEYLIGTQDFVNRYANALKPFELAEKCINWITGMHDEFKSNITSDIYHYIRPIIDRRNITNILSVSGRNYFMVVDKGGEYRVIHPKGENEDSEGIVFQNVLFHFIEYLMDHEGPFECPLAQNCGEVVDECLTKPYVMGIKDVGEEICPYGQVSQFFFIHEVPVELP